MGNLQQALVCFEKRLVVAHELDKPAAKGKYCETDHAILLIVNILLSESIATISTKVQG